MDIEFEDNLKREERVNLLHQKLNLEYDLNWFKILLI
jgi:hypothetical protein